MGTNPIWYQLADDLAKKHTRPLRHDERAAFVEGVVAAFELAEEHELLTDLNADLDAFVATD